MFKKLNHSAKPKIIRKHLDNYLDKTINFIFQKI